MQQSSESVKSLKWDVSLYNYFLTLSTFTFYTENIQIEAPQAQNLEVFSELNATPFPILNVSYESSFPGIK